MPRLIEGPVRITAGGHPPKQIEEFVGRVRTGDLEVSVARMVSPAGWTEPGQRPRFEEISIVLHGQLNVEHDNGVLMVRAGQAVVTAAGGWVRYSTPDAGGAEYISVCRPSFSPASVHRDDDEGRAHSKG